MDKSVSRKKGRPNFPEAAVEAEPFFLICCSHQREIAAIDTIDSSLA
jgi:hypothetical protein